MNAGSRKILRNGPMRPTHGESGYSARPASRLPFRSTTPWRHDDARRNTVKTLKLLALGLALALTAA